MDWVYMLECGDGSLYTGWTNDLARRLAAHQSGRGAKYTRGRAPVRLVYASSVRPKAPLCGGKPLSRHCRGRASWS